MSNEHTPTVYVEKIRLRRGQEAELPGRPTNFDPLTFSEPLPDGELAMTVDSGRLFVGCTPETGDVHYNRTVFPYQNVEVLTENSPRVREIIGDAQKDQNNLDFFLATNLPRNNSLQELPHQELDNHHIIPSVFTTYNRACSIVIEYTIFTDEYRPAIVKQGVMRFITSFMNNPIGDYGTPNELAITNQSLIGNGLDFELQWSGYRREYLLMYHNRTGRNLRMIMRRTVVQAVTSTIMMD